MSLYAIASAAVASLNPMITAVWKQSTGVSGQNADFSQNPQYTTSSIQIQDQALGAPDLRHLDALNIQTVTRKVWANGNLQGVNQATGQGGDLLTFNGQTWLVVTVFETWDNGNWCSVGLALQ